MTRALSVIINTVIFVSTLIIVTAYFRKDGRWDKEKGYKAFRFFTCLSNVLCAIAAFFMVIVQISGTVPRGIWLLK